MSKPITDVLIYLALASARDEGLPEPIGIRVSSSRSEPVVDVHLASAGDRQQWREWFDRRGATKWATSERDVSGSRFHYARAVWRGWKVELVYLTPVETEAGEIR